MTDAHSGRVVTDAGARVPGGRMRGPWSIHEKRRNVIMCGPIYVATAAETKDALLITAAPDLLAVLRTIRSFMIPGMNFPGMNWTDDTGTALRHQADAAIAKAEGRS